MLAFEAIRVLAFGDSLTNGYSKDGKCFHPYGLRLERLLNEDQHGCFKVDVSGKTGEESAHMLQRLSHHLNQGNYLMFILLNIHIREKYR